MRTARVAWFPVALLLCSGSLAVPESAAGEEAEALRLLEQGRAAAAAVLLEELAGETAPARLHLALGVARYDAGREAEAEQSWQRALERGADRDAEGDVCLRARFNLARLAFDRAERQAADAGALGSAIEALLEARHFLALALRERPDSAPVQQALEVVSGRLRDCDQREAAARTGTARGNGAGDSTGRQRESGAAGEGAGDPAGAPAAGRSGAESGAGDAEREGGGEAEGDFLSGFLDLDRSAQLFEILQRILLERDAVRREKARASSAEVERDW